MEVYQVESLVPSTRFCIQLAEEDERIPIIQEAFLKRRVQFKEAVGQIVATYLGRNEENMRGINYSKPIGGLSAADVEGVEGGVSKVQEGEVSLSEDNIESKPKKPWWKFW